VKAQSEKPLIIAIAASSTVGTFKEIIKQESNSEGKFLRLIHQVCHPC
jgi:hypothetical protein